LKQLATYVLLLTAASSAGLAQTDFSLTGNIKHVLLISIDGMHSLDFLNCSQGRPSINGGQSFCPNLAQLAQSGTVYTNALTPRPSDSFPGLVAQITGGNPRTAGVYYDVSYDRALSPPAVTTPYGLWAAPLFVPLTGARRLALTKRSTSTIRNSMAPAE